MTITAEQRETRKGFIGASDAAAICGCSPFASAYDVWAEKTGQMEGERAESSVQSAGNALERGVIDWAASQLKVEVEHSPETVIHPGGIIAVNLDALVIGHHGAIEGKTVGLECKDWRALREMQAGWGADGTDEVPAHVMIQVHTQMLVCGFATVWVAALINGMGLNLYRIDRNDKLCAALDRKLHAFWHDYVLTGIAPPSAPRIETAKRLRREPGTVTTIDPALFDQAVKATELRLAAEKFETSVLSSVHAALGQNEAAECELGRVTFCKVASGAYRRLNFQRADKPKSKKGKTNGNGNGND